MKNYTKVVKRFDDILSRGLSKGLGNRDGQMCVEAAICAAMGLPHGDDPKCVAETVRAFKINLNDRDWSSPEARAKGLRDLGIAQLGSLGVVDDGTFDKLMMKGVIQLLLPDLFERMFPDDADCTVAVNNCRAEGTADAAKELLPIAQSTIGLSRSSFYALLSRSSFHAFHAANYAMSGYGYYHVIRHAHLTKAADNDYYFLMGAKLALEVLRELKSPGCDYL